MKTQELELINDMLELINTRVPNAAIKNYIEEHLCKLLNGNNKINDLTTGIELYDTNDKDEIIEYFKLLFYPTKNDFNFKDFSKIEIVYKCGEDSLEKKIIEFSNSLIEVNELQIINKKSLNQINFTIIQNLLKQKYLNDHLVYNYKFVSKINSDFLLPSYDIEEETFIESKSSTTKSVVIVPNYSNEVAIKNDVKETNTLLAKYIANHDLENVSFINSDYLVGKTFSTNEKQMISIPNDIILSSTTRDAYQNMQKNLAKKI